jgi:hypothetical protein
LTPREKVKSPTPWHISNWLFHGTAVFDNARFCVAAHQLVVGKSRWTNLFWQIETAAKGPQV